MDGRFLALMTTLNVQWIAWLLSRHPSTFHLRLTWTKREEKGGVDVCGGERAETLLT